MSSAPRAGFAWYGSEFERVGGGGLVAGQYRTRRPGRCHLFRALLSLLLLLVVVVVSCSPPTHHYDVFAAPAKYDRAQRRVAGPLDMLGADRRHGCLPLVPR